MPDRFAHGISDREFVQRVRRHRPSSLLPLVSAAAAHYNTKERWLSSPHRKLTPWALADVARVSVMSANEHRKSADEHDLLECCAAHEAVVDHELRDVRSSDSLSRFMARLAYQQFQFQGSPYGEFGRTLALYTLTDSPTKSLQVLTSGWQSELLGCSLLEYCAVGFMLHVGAIQNSGTFDEAWLEQPQFEQLIQYIPADRIALLLKSFFVADISELRRIQQEHDDRFAVDESLRRLSFNALQDRPAISGIQERLLLPSPRLLLNRVSCLGLFHVGVKHFGNSFSDDTGHLFEQYVGRQLRLMPSTEVLPEIAYGRGGNQKSVDWIVVNDEVVLLVEVKAKRPVEAIRLGTDDSFESTLRSLGGAISQVSRSADRIYERHAAFLEVPTGRPIVGLVVTLERFYLANSNAFSEILRGASIPTVILSASELEHLVTVVSEHPCELISRGVDLMRSGQWTFEGAMEGVEMTNNQLLDDAWNELPWREAH